MSEFIKRIFGSNTLANLIKEHNLLEINKQVTSTNVNNKIVRNEGCEFKPIEFSCILDDPKQIELIKYFVSVGGSLDEYLDKDRHPNHTLHRCVLSGESITFLHSQNVNFNTTYGHLKLNLLSHAIRFYDYGMVKAVLALKLDFLDDGFPFWSHITRSIKICSRTVKLLISYGFPYCGTKENAYGDALLAQVFTSVISEDKMIKVLNVFIHNNYKFNINECFGTVSGNDTLLGLAIKNRYPLLVKRLIELGVDTSSNQRAVYDLLLDKDQIDQSSSNHTRFDLRTGNNKISSIGYL